MRRNFYDGTADGDSDDRFMRRGGDRRDDASLGEDDALDDGDDAALDEAFPRGDGTADTDTVVICPYCGELNEIAVDPGGGPAQSYVEDCQVCCRPWRVAVVYDATGHATASVEPADDY